MAQELQGGEIRHASQQHIASVTSTNRQCQTINEGFRKEFRDYFEKLFTKESRLSSAHFAAYLPTSLVSR